MNKKVVVFDIDGVLANFEGKLVTALLNEFGYIGSLNRHMFSLEERFKNYPKILQRALQYVANPNFYYSIEKNEDACRLAGEFMEREYGVLYVSSRPRSHENFTRRWLQKNTYDYKKSLGLFCGVSDKSDFLRDVPVGFLVEDNPEEITRCKKLGIPVLCWRQPWNQDFYPSLYARDGIYTVQMNEETEPIWFWKLFQ